MSLKSIDKPSYFSTSISLSVNRSDPSRTYKYISLIFRVIGSRCISTFIISFEFLSIVVILYTIFSTSSSTFESFPNISPSDE
ncbi:hypothetical protein QW71_27860 [Paenibacillus sp. IHB B 3415]|nr:hypothetical protein QW71_27860 [Paenibacillus sp. IHB B 3415]